MVFADVMYGLAAQSPVRLAAQTHEVVISQLVQMSTPF